MKKWFAILLVMIPCFSARPQGTYWRQLDDKRWQISFHASDASNAQSLAKFVSAALPHLEASLGSTLETPAHIWIAANQSEFDHLTNAGLPEWSQGVSYPEQNKIVLKSPRFSGDIEIFHRTAAHELVHQLIAHKVRTNIPRWLNEGLALVLSGEGREKPLMPLSRAVWMGGVQPLASVEEVDRLPHAAAELAYLESFSAADFLVRQFGWESVRRMLNDLGSGTYWQDALFKETEMDQAGFEALWLTNLDKSYRWMILLDVPTFIFFGITLLVLVVGVLIYRRRRQTYRRWEAEEAMEKRFL